MSLCSSCGQARLQGSCRRPAAIGARAPWSPQEEQRVVRKGKRQRPAIPWREGGGIGSRRGGKAHARVRAQTGSQAVSETPCALKLLVAPVRATSSDSTQRFGSGCQTDTG